MNRGKTNGLLVLLVVLLLLLSPSLFAGGDGEKTPAGGTAEGKGTTIVIAAERDPGSLAPYGSEGPRNYPCWMLYETLARTNLEGKLEKNLAKDIKQVAEGVYQVTIYDYIHDTAGNHMTASDVIFSFDQFKKEGSGANYVSSLDSIRAIDEYTVEIRMQKERIGIFDQMLNKVRIITQKAWEDSEDEMMLSPVGTSPYKLVEYVPGSYLLYTKTNDYWQKDPSLVSTYSQANVDNVRLNIITDLSTQAVALEAGDIHGSTYISTADQRNFVDQNGNAKAGYTKSSFYHSVIFHFVFNCSDKSPCRDINLRRAISTCFDAEAIAKVYYGYDGWACKAPNTVACLDYDPANEATPYFPYDVEKAKQYLAASSYKGETIRLLVGTNAGQKEAATLVQSYCEKIGIKVELMIYDRALYTQHQRDNSGEKYDIDFSGSNTFGYTWVQLKELDAGNYKNGLNHCIIYDDTLQKLYDAAAELKTASKESTNKLLAYIEEKCYTRGLYHRAKVAITNDHITNVVLASNGDFIPGACTVSPDK